jgi:hypothetical protein
VEGPIELDGPIPEHDRQFSSSRLPLVLRPSPWPGDFSARSPAGESSESDAENHNVDTGTSGRIEMNFARFSHNPLSENRKCRRLECLNSFMSDGKRGWH